MTLAFLKLLSSPRAWIALALSILLAFTHLSAYRHGRQSVQAKWDAANVAQQAAAEKQAQANRDLQRQAELHYTVQREAQDRFITLTTKEVVHETAPLAACVLPDGAIRLLNAARECAAGNTPGACGAGDSVPGSSHP